MTGLGFGHAVSNFQAPTPNFSLSQAAPKRIGFTIFEMIHHPWWPWLGEKALSGSSIYRQRSQNRHSTGQLPHLDSRFATGRQLQVTARYAPQGDSRNRLQEAEHVCVCRHCGYARNPSGSCMPWTDKCVSANRLLSE